MNDKAVRITEENLTMENLSEYIHNAIGEASTLFYQNDEYIFDEGKALKIAERLIKGITKLVEEANS